MCTLSIMFQRINRIKEKGYTPDLIFDIGAEKGSWTRDMLNIYPYSKYILCEAIDYSELNNFNTSNFIVIKELLFDSEKEVDWYEMRNTGDSIFKERGNHFKNCVAIKRKTITLNNLIKSKNIVENKKNILIKIDCQGAEISILKGATDILDKTDFIVLEIPLFGQYNEGVPNFLEHIQFMDSIGFIPYDIADNHYINGFNRQIDMIFISKSHNFNSMTEYH
jgi:FkbM family methyltransferase